MNVLIPTDFTVQSLDIIKNATLRFSDKKLNIILFHALHMPTDIQELLFLPKEVPHEKITESFRHACAAIKRKNSQNISQISFKYMYGNSNAVFKNFIEANDIACIYMPTHVTLSKPYQNSVALLPLFKKASVPFITTNAVKETTPAKSIQQHYSNAALAEG